MSDPQSQEPSRVLVIEDSRTQAEELRLVLEGGGFEAEVALEGESGLSLAEHGAFDLVLSDILLPGMSGYEVCRVLKADPRLRETPVLLLTSLNDPRALIQTLECGADGFLTKPYEPQYLLGRVRGILQSRRGEAGGEPLLGGHLGEGTDRRQILGMLASAYEEAVRSARELEAKHRQLVETQRQKDELAAFIVHDLKNPLNDIEMRLQLLLRRVADERDRRSLAAARSACSSMSRMVMNLLDIGRAEEGALPTQREPVRIAELLDEVVASMRLRAEMEQKELVRLPAPDDPIWELDRGLMTRVLENLVDNSLKYAGEGSRVELGVRRADGALELWVADGGPGIPDPHKRRIFQKYARLEGDDPEHGRTSRGLGLTFSLLAVEAHRGSIEVRDQEPQGSLFVIRLPEAP